MSYTTQLLAETDGKQFALLGSSNPQGETLTEKANRMVRSTVTTSALAATISTSPGTYVTVPFNDREVTPQWPVDEADLPTPIEQHALRLSVDRSELLKREFLRQSSTREEQARLELLEKRLDVFLQSISQAQLSAAEEVLEKLESRNRRVNEIIGKYNLRSE